VSPLVALLVAYAVTVLINIAPGFMPPTWAVLAVFLVRYDLPLLVVTLGGAVASTLGRLVLAVGSRRWGTRLLSQRRRRGLRQLGEWLDAKPRWAVPLVVALFALGPVPSNAVFIGAGLTRMRLAPVALGFLVGRAISYTALDLLSRHAASNVRAVFESGWTDPKALVLDALMLAGTVALAFVDWPKLLHVPDGEAAGPDDGTAPAAQDAQVRAGARR
jgi:membrane protein YqaA with SNARE-associated domain